MSTRCVVRIKEKFDNKTKKVDLYHHHDGYIEGVGFDLLNYLYDFEKKELKTSDLYYTVNFLIKQTKDEYNYTPYNHGDIEYFYEIDVDKQTITGWNVNNWGKKMLKYQKYTMKDILKKYEEFKKSIDK